MTPSAPGICPFCGNRHETCSLCGGQTGCDEGGEEICTTCLSADAEFDRMDAEHWENSVGRQSEIDYGGRDDDGNATCATCDEE